MPKGWQRRFDDPIDLRRSRKLIIKLPKAKHSALEWQAAIEALTIVATRGGPTMHARIGVLRALHRDVERMFNPDRKETSRSGFAATDSPWLE